LHTNELGKLLGAVSLPFDPSRGDMVMAHVTVSITAAALLQLLDGPALLSKQVRLSNCVVDAVVIHAHPQMAQWYGFSDPIQMQGLYLSQLHDRECLAQVRRYSVARLLGLPPRTLEGIEQGRGFRYPKTLLLAMQAATSEARGKANV